jgi:hypothetical protein
MRCPRCNSTILPPATSCGCATAPTSSTQTLPVAETPPVKPAVGVFGTAIPTGNKPALIGYYLVFVALLPYVKWEAFGVHLGIDVVARGVASGVTAAVAVVFGAVGVRRARAHPEVRGGKHAWLAIVVGAMIAAAWLCAAFGVIRY